MKNPVCGVAIKLSYVHVRESTLFLCLCRKDQCFDLECCILLQFCCCLADSLQGVYAKRHVDVWLKHTVFGKLSKKSHPLEFFSSFDLSFHQLLVQFSRIIFWKMRPIYEFSYTMKNVIVARK